MYPQTSTLNAATGRTTTAPAAGHQSGDRPAAGPTTILISSDPTATDISVACDAEGDFIATWSAYSATTSWDVYAALYDSTGKVIKKRLRGQHLHRERAERL